MRFLVLFGAMGLGSVAFADGKRYAVVIGVRKYLNDDARLPLLAYAERDAERLSESLDLLSFSNSALATGARRARDPGKKKLSASFQV